MFVAKKDATSEAQSGAFYAPQNLISQRVPLPATESRETTQKLSIGPKELDWACSLRKNMTQLRNHKVVHFMHPKPDLTTCTSRLRNRAKSPRNLVLGLKTWIGQVRCENKTQLRKHKVVHCMHPKTR